VRVFVRTVGRCDQQDLKGVSVEVDGTTGHVINE
jgi:hypothetical protein